MFILYTIKEKEEEGEEEQSRVRFDESKNTVRYMLNAENSLLSVAHHNTANIESRAKRAAKPLLVVIVEEETLKFPTGAPSVPEKTSIPPPARGLVSPSTRSTITTTTWKCM